MARCYSSGIPDWVEDAEDGTTAISLLDPVARRPMWALVQSLRADYGPTVLLTTHFMEEADVLCDRIALTMMSLFFASNAIYPLTVMPDWR